MNRSHYSAYKPSGVEWLGEVPAHWEVKRLKHGARYSVSSVDELSSDDELPVRLCSYTDVCCRGRIRPETAGRGHMGRNGYCFNRATSRSTTSKVRP